MKESDKLAVRLLKHISITQYWIEQGAEKVYETETKKKKDKARNRYTDRKREREGMEKK